MTGDDYGGKKVPRPLKRLMEAHQILADTESLEALFPRLLDLAKNVSNAEAASLLLYNQQRNVLEFAAVKDEVLGEKADEILKSAVELKMGEGIAGWVAQNRESVLIADAQNDPRFSSQADQETGFVTRTILCVPLLYGGDLLGVINVLNSKDKPGFDDFDEELLECFADLASTAIMRSRFLDLRLTQERIQIELEAAANIQSLFWPGLPELGARSHVWALSKPAKFVGGDVYDVIRMPDESWLVYVADVADKGLPAALIMAALSTRIRSEALSHHEVDTLLETVNNAMCVLAGDEGFFATIVLGRYWPADGRMQLTLGGHLPPLLIVDDQLRELSELRGISLGVAPDAAYEKKDIFLSPGESILFVTDGVTEAENERAELYGRSRLSDHITSATGPPYGKGLLDAVNAWRGSAEANDDLTMMEIWREPE
ncbi:MAG: SpoIIE family protein phosphatase [Desulfobacterales bacterium]|nr:SpoIIE family protein phosphatase [Deltaproteobacteria bacterium]NIR14764.1 SpoIIE family protein phosphatase [Desulfobacterales bacterium]